MNDLLLFALLGLGTGALYASLALGVVLAYRAAGVINLATGAMAMLAGYAFWWLRTRVGVATGPALAGTFAFMLLVGATIEAAAFARLRASPPLAKLVASLGVLLVAQASMLLAFGAGQQPQPRLLPTDTVAVLGSRVPVDRLILAGIAILMAAGLGALHRWTRFGLATRAAADNEVAGMFAGLSTTRLSMANALLASVVATVIGVTAASITQLDPTSLPLAIVPALAAALFARFSSFAVACAVGLGIGVLNSLIDYASTKSWFPTVQGLPLPGVKELTTLAIIIIAMLLRGKLIPSRGQLVEQRLPEVPFIKRPAASLLPLVIACVVALLVVPFDFRQALINSLIGVVMALSLVVITGFVGQMSVVQLALAGLSGFAIAHLAGDAGIGFPIAPVIAALGTTLVGLLVATCALRIRGVSLAVVTLAAGVAITQFVFLNPTWGGGNTGSPVPAPHLVGFDVGPDAPFRGATGGVPSPIFGLLVLAIAAGAWIAVAKLRHIDVGRQMLAVRSNERAAAVAGINVRNAKLAAFAISSFLAGTAGALYAYNFGSVSATRFDAVTGLSLIAFAYVGGIASPIGALIAGAISTEALVPHALDKYLGISGNWLVLIGGALLVAMLARDSGGAAGALMRRRRRRSPADMVQRRQRIDVAPTTSLAIDSAIRR